MKGRTRLELFYDILSPLKSNSPQPLTNLMYSARLPHYTLKGYCQELNELGLIERVPIDTKNKSSHVKILWNITTKGFDFIIAYENLLSIMNFENEIRKQTLKGYIEN